MVHIRHRTVWSALASIAILLAVGCTSGGAAGSVQNRASRSPLPLNGAAQPPSSTGNFEIAFSDRERQDAPDVSDEDLGELVAGNSRFAFDLYSRLATEEGNLFLSPYSISSALAMVYLGAAGETADEMADALEFTLSPEQLHPGFDALSRMLITRGDGLTTDRAFDLEIENSVWGQRSFKLEQQFLDGLAQHYGSGMRLVDFAKDHEEARVAINKWVEQKTNERIEELLLPDNVGPDTLMVLVNTIFFAAAWLEPFHRAIDTEFHLLDGTMRSTPFMSDVSQYHHTDGEGFQAVKIPYATTGASTGRSTSMVVVLPDPGKFEEVESSLSADKIEQIRSDLDTLELVTIYLPRFRFESRLSLPNVLKELGMNQAFSDIEADFQGMHGMPPPSGIFIGDVIHDAFIAVDEQGTEAAAATAATLVFSGLVDPDIQFVADRPFIFFIQDDETGSILFMGRMMNPCAEAGVCPSGDVPSATPNPEHTVVPRPGRRPGVVGPVMAYSAIHGDQQDVSVSKIVFDVELRDYRLPIDLTPPYVLDTSCGESLQKSLESDDQTCSSPVELPGAPSTTGITFTGQNQYLPDVPWTVEFHPGSSDDYILDSGELATVTVWLMKHEFVVTDGTPNSGIVGWEPDASGSHGVLADGGFPVHANEGFNIELIAEQTRPLNIYRTVPIRLEQEMNLN